MKIAIFGLIIIAVLLSAGCVDKDPNYENTHTVVGYDAMGCSPYYESITIIDKTSEIISSGFGSDTRYVIVANDNIEREAVNFRVYRSLEINKTYQVISSDLMGCGYLHHHVRIEEVK